MQALSRGLRLAEFQVMVRSLALIALVALCSPQIADAEDFVSQIEDEVARDMLLLAPPRAETRIRQMDLSTGTPGTTISVIQPEENELYSLSIEYQSYENIPLVPMHLSIGDQSMDLGTRWQQWLQISNFLEASESRDDVVDAIVFFVTQARQHLNAQKAQVRQIDTGSQESRRASAAFLRVLSLLRSLRARWERIQPTSQATSPYPTLLYFGEATVELQRQALLSIPSSVWVVPQFALSHDPTGVARQISELGPRGAAAIEEFDRFKEEHGPLEAGVALVSEIPGLPVLTRRLIHVSNRGYAGDEASRNLARAKRLEFAATTRAYYAAFRMGLQNNDSEFTVPALGAEEGDLLTPFESMVALQVALAKLQKPITVHVALQTNPDEFKRITDDLSDWQLLNKLVERFGLQERDNCERYLGS